MAKKWLFLTKKVAIFEGEHLETLFAELRFKNKHEHDKNFQENSEKPENGVKSKATSLLEAD